MKRTVFLAGRRLELTPTMLLAQGGEAEIYDLGDGRVLKHLKPAEHPDFAGDLAAQASATRACAQLGARLAALPATLPVGVVRPCELATRTARGRDAVGFTMVKVEGASLHLFGEPTWRRDHGVDLDRVGRIAAALRTLLDAIHRAGVVVGDLSDLNILVESDTPRLIDIDSAQLPGFDCTMFTDRFVDPRLCDPRGPELRLAQRHDRDSDWFAFAAITLRLLVGVGPWGGVYRPADLARRATPSERVLRRISVFDPEVVWPRAALPLRALPDALVAWWQATVRGAVRGAPPPEVVRVLETLRFVACPACGEQTSRPRCAGCGPTPRTLPSHPPGTVRVSRIEPRDRVAAVWPVGLVEPAPGDRTAPAIWRRGGVLWRRGPFGPEAIGSIVSGEAHLFTGGTWGLGFYRVGGLTVWVTFATNRGGLADTLRLPPIRGAIVQVQAAMSDELGWLFVTTSELGRLTTTAYVVDRHGVLVACECVAAAHGGATWAEGLPGACAVGALLFVPTDDGIARIEARGGQLILARHFLETAPYVRAGDTLSFGPPGAGGIDVVGRDGALRLHLS